MPDKNTINNLYAIFLSHPRVCTDSRAVEPGSLFFALKGDKFDGNDYAAAALQAGAAYCVVDDEKAAVSDRCILVDNVLKTLAALARHHRMQLAIPVLAITGSNGKTTTKELITRVLACKYTVAATRGNLNNHIGVPLTLLSMDSATGFGVVEMGANHRGEIEDLCSTARPDYGIITNIGKSHLEGFGGIEGVAKGKGELFNYLAANGGVAFYSTDSPRLHDMAVERKSLKSFGFSADNLKILPEETNTLTVVYHGITIRTNLVGDYNRHNVAAALAVAGYFGVSDRDAAAAVESYVPDNIRSQRKASQHNIIYMDAYNANPSSMAAAIENFAAAGEAGYEKALILGDMLELGEYAADEHAAILAALRRHAFTKVYLVGELFAGVNANNDFPSFPDVEKLGAHLLENPLEKHVVLIKGSRGMRLEKTEQYL